MRFARLAMVMISALGALAGCSSEEESSEPDTTPPAVLLIAPTGGEVWGGTRDMAWFTVDEARGYVNIEVSSDGGAAWTALAVGAPDAGTYSWDTSATADGASYRVRVMAVDASGNASGWSASAWDFSVDNTAPSVAMVSPEGGEVLGGVRLIEWLTDDAHPWTAEIEISADSGGAWSPLASGVDDDGACAWNSSSEADGALYRLRVRATDRAGNVSSWSESADFELDNAAPSLSLASPAGGELWSGARFVTWSTTDANIASVGIEISGDSGANWAVLDAGAPDLGAWALDTSAHADGTAYRVRVRAVDRAGNQSSWSAASSDLEFDNTAPGVSLTSPVGGETWTGAQTVSWAGADANPGTVTIELSADSGVAWSTIAAGAGDSGAWAWNTLAHPSGTTYRIRITATDGAGNSSAPAASASDFALDQFIVRTMGGASSDQAFAVDLDAAGNAYVVGNFTGTADFRADWGGGSDTRTSAGVDDVFVTRINADGTYGWTRQIGGAQMDLGRAVAVDGSGNVYVRGFFAATVDFRQAWGGGTDSKTVTGAGNDIFLTKINADGSYGWTRRFVVGGYITGIQDLAVDGSGNIYVPSFFGGTRDFRQDWGGGTDSKTSSGAYDGSLTKINADGSYGWTRRIGGTGTEQAICAATDGSGNVFLGGAFEGTVDFRQDWGGGADSKTSAGLVDAFLTRVNSDGSYGWTRRMGGTGPEAALNVAADAQGNAFIAGEFFGTVDFLQDWGVGTDSRTASGAASDVFVARVNAGGSYGWTRRFGGANQDDARGIAVDGSGGVYLSGMFQSTVDFRQDWGGYQDLKTSSTGNSSFLTLLQSDGSYQWTKLMGGGVQSHLGVGADGSVFTAGFFNIPINFRQDWGGSLVKTPQGSNDAFFFRAK